MITRSVITTFSMALLALSAGEGYGQNFPVKPIRILTGSAGGSNDAAARLIKSGRLRGLAVTSSQPSELAAGLPTLAASGVPGYEIVGIDAMYAPAKTPASVVHRLNEEIVRFLSTAEAKAKYLILGGEVVASSPEEHLAKIQSRVTTIGKLIRDAGIKVN